MTDARKDHPMGADKIPGSVFVRFEDHHPQIYHFQSPVKEGDFRFVPESSLLAEQQAHALAEGNAREEKTMAKYQAERERVKALLFLVKAAHHALTEGDEYDKSLVAADLRKAMKETQE